MNRRSSSALRSNVPGREPRAPVLSESGQWQKDGCLAKASCAGLFPEDSPGQRRPFSSLQNLPRMMLGQTMQPGIFVKRIFRFDAEGWSQSLRDSGERQRLRAEFQACREGRRSCPTDEYEKLDALEVEKSAGKISLRLTAKSRQVFDSVEIQKCLNHDERNSIKASSALMA